MMDLKVIVATHKRYDIPKRNYLYPVFAGAALSKEDLPYQRDDLFTDYCHFLFDVLEKTEEKTGNIDRLYGYLGERLLDVYIEKNKIKYQEVHVLNTEPTNWPKKIAEFLKRKFIR